MFTGFLLLLILFEFSYSQNGIRLSIDGVGLTDYTQVTPELISDSQGLWCTADTPPANGIYWRLSNGVILPEVNATYSEYGIKTIAVDRRSKNIGLGIFVVDNSKLMEGVYECSVLDLYKEGEITMVNVWLARELHPPLLQDSSCELEALLPFNDATAVLAYTEVLHGPPTVIACHVAGDEPLTTIGMSRRIVNRGGTTTSAAVTIGLSIPIGSYPSELNCSFSNNAGSSSYMCFLREPILSPPVITGVELTITGTFFIQWDHTLDLHLLSRYIVYIQAPDNSTVRVSTTHPRLEIPNKEFNLVANENIVVAAFTQITESNAITIFLPAISNEDLPIPMQCRPSERYEIGVTIEPSSIQTTEFLLVSQEYFESIVEQLLLKEFLMDTNECSVTVELGVVTEKTRRTKKTKYHKDFPNLLLKKKEKHSKNNEDKTKQEEHTVPVKVDSIDNKKSTKKPDNTLKKGKKSNSKKSKSKSSNIKKKISKSKTMKKTKSKGKSKKKKKTKRQNEDIVFDISQTRSITFTSTVQCISCDFIMSNFLRRQLRHASSTGTHNKSPKSRLTMTRHKEKTNSRSKINRPVTQFIISIGEDNNAIATINNETIDTYYCGDELVSPTDICDCPLYCIDG